MLSKEIGTLQDVIQYFNTHSSLFERQDHDKGHMERVMAVLTQQNMEHLEKQFQLYAQGLQLPTFIYLIKKLYIPDHQMSKYFFVSDLIKFFQAIDINGDGHLQWSQFTEYIIQNIRVIQKPRYKNKAFQQNQIISSAYSKISNEYKLTKIHDLGCQSTIRKIIYMEQIQQYYLIQSQTHSIRVFDSGFKEVDVVHFQVGNYKNTIVDFSVDKENRIIGCIFQDYLYFCNMKLRNAGSAVNKQSSISYKKYTKIQYLPHHKLWSISSTLGQLKLFTITYPNRTLMTLKQHNHLHCHQSSITSIIQIDQPKCLATCSMDGNIKLYSKYLDKYYTFQHIGQQTNSVVNQGRKKGILSICYSGEFGNYVLAYGFSNAIFIYSLDISLTKGYTGKYTQHTGAIMWAKFIKSYPYVLSFDDKMNMRIWDFRKYQTIQFINCEKIFINPSRLEIFPQLFQVLICQKKITQFRAPALQKKSKQINEFHNIFDFKFCSMTNQIFVFTSNDVRVYNFFTGSLKKLFTKLYQSNCQTNITACQFGFKCRRFFVGDAGGFVRQFCSQTGQQLQNIDPGDEINYQSKQISKILFMKQHSLLICCSIDGRIMIYQRNQQGEFIIIRDIRQCHQQFLCAAASDRYCLLATAGDTGDIVLWNLQKYVMEGLCVVNSKPIGVAFCSIHPVMVVATQDGHLNFFYVKPYQGKEKYKCFAKISINSQSVLKQPSTLMSITSFSCQLIVNAYFPKQCTLNTQQNGNHHFIAAVGTNTGQVLLINLNKIFKLYKVEQNHQIYVIKNCHRCQVQVMKSIIVNERNRVLLNGYTNNIDNINYIDQFVHSNINVAEEPIENLLISKECSAIFCKSVDKKLKVYSFKSQYNGAINFATFKKIFWKIPEVNFFKKLQAIDTTIYSIKLIENKKFKPQQQSRLKVHLLLNQYLSNKQKQQYCQWLQLKNNKNDHNKIIRQKVKKVDTQNIVSELQFNQIYNKLKNSIEKSLQDFNNTEKIFWAKGKTKIKLGKPSQLTQTQQINEDKLEQSHFRVRTKQRKNTKRQQQSTGKIKTRTTIKFDPCFQLFGRKAEQPVKEVQKKKKSMLFTSLSTAKKIIKSNFSATGFR